MEKLSLTELHFSQTYTTQRANKNLLGGLVVIGLLILLIACMNFVNLETALAINRSREVGIRKTLGSSRNQLIVQFLVETFVLVWIAIAVSFCLSELALTYFRDFLPNEMVIAYFSIENMLFLFGLSLILTAISGLYPAVILGNYEPVRAMKQEKTAFNGFSFGHFLRKNLTVIQFTLSIAFIIAVLAINKQIGFIYQQDLGFDKEVVLYAYTPYQDPLNRNYNLKSQLEQQSAVKAVSLSSEMIASSSLWTTLVEFGEEDEKKEYEVQVKNIDRDFLEVNGLELLAGRNIREISGEVLVNQAMVTKLGLEDAEQLIGKILDYDEDKLTVVGVTGNFHTRTLRESIRPIIMYHDSSNLHVINVKLEPGSSVLQAKNSINNIYRRIYPHEENEFVFLDEVIERFYKDDQSMQEVLGFVSGLAILISCMGLFGLSSFTINRRLKELSIRKVLGASISQILILVSKEYVILVLIAFLLASIPAWLFLNDWLKAFSIKIDMPWELFIMSGMVALLLCLLIVGLHSLKAAQKNPAEILKSE